MFWHEYCICSIPLAIFALIILMPHQKHGKKKIAKTFKRDRKEKSGKTEKLMAEWRQYDLNVTQKPTHKVV